MPLELSPQSPAHCDGQLHVAGALRGYVAATHLLIAQVLAPHDPKEPRLWPAPQIQHHLRWASTPVTTCCYPVQQHKNCAAQAATFWMLPEPFHL